jgi:hypothetical protein
MEYSHTQRAPLGIILYLTGITILAVALFAIDAPAVPYILAAAGAITLLAGLMFGHLTVRDEGEYLGVRFGPLRVFRTRIAYAEMTSVEPDRTSIIDGWGVHYIPWRGATYNLWGFGCVKILLNGRVIRVGTDDVEGLTAFLQRKVSDSRAA